MRPLCAGARRRASPVSFFQWGKTRKHQCASPLPDFRHGAALAQLWGTHTPASHVPPPSPLPPYRSPGSARTSSPRSPNRRSTALARATHGSSSSAIPSSAAASWRSVAVSPPAAWFCSRCASRAALRARLPLPPRLRGRRTSPLWHSRARAMRAMRPRIRSTVCVLAARLGPTAPPVRRRCARCQIFSMGIYFR
jgi:hypothetical protein